MNNEHYIAVGHVSDAARQALIEADCFVHQVSIEPPLVAIALRYQDEHDLTFVWSSADTEIQINSSGLYLIWRSSSNQEPPYASCIDTSVSTYDEWCQEREEAAAKTLAAIGWDGELGDLDEAPF
jgi:hypothetical protein